MGSPRCFLLPHSQGQRGMRPAARDLPFPERFWGCGVWCEGIGGLPGPAGAKVPGQAGGHLSPGREGAHEQSSVAHRERRARPPGVVQRSACPPPLALRLRPPLDPVP